MPCVFSAICLPQHLEHPLIAHSAHELADLVDEIARSEDYDCNYATVRADADGYYRAAMSIGVLAAPRVVGGLMYHGRERNFFSRGMKSPEEPVRYYEFGVARYFPGDSEIELGIVKAALASFFECPDRLPQEVEWQEWDDTAVVGDDLCAVDRSGDGYLLEEDGWVGSGGSESYSMRSSER